MKLIRCNFCNDIFSLIYEEERTCRCGLSRGQYINHGQAVVYGEHAIPFAIATEDLLRGPVVNDKCAWLTDILRCWYITPSAYDYGEIIHKP